MINKFLGNTKWILILILLGAFFIRIISISENPIAMYGDELTMVLDVNSILKTGYDQTGQFLPLTFKMGDNRPVGYGYFSMPFVALFGTSALGIRALSVLSGVGIILVIFLLGKRLFSRASGLVAAGIIALSPWDIVLSRGGFETHFALFLALLGVYFFLQAREKPGLYILSALSFALSMHTYSTFKLMVPGIIVLLVWYTGFNVISHNFKKNTIYVVIASLLILSSIAIIGIQSVVLNSESRFLSLNIFSQTNLKHDITQKINHDIATSSMPQEIARLFHNKPIEYADTLIKLYLKNFSVDFLFLTGDRNPRHNMALMGQLYLVEIITIFFGIAFLLKERHKSTTIFLFSWIFLAALPPTLLMQTHALRGSFMLPPLALISALGVVYIWCLKGKGIMLLKCLIFAIFLIQFITFLERTFFTSPNQFSRFWSYPAKIASYEAMANKKLFDYIILSDRIDNMEFAYPVYDQIDPKQVLDQNIKQTQLGEYRFRNYGNVYIGALPDTKINSFMTQLDGSVMFIGTPEESAKSTGYEVVMGKDKEKAITIFKKNRQQ